MKKKRWIYTFVIYHPMGLSCDILIYNKETWNFHKNEYTIQFNFKWIENIYLWWLCSDLNGIYKSIWTTSHMVQMCTSIQIIKKTNDIWYRTYGNYGKVPTTTYDHSLLLINHFYLFLIKSLSVLHVTSYFERLGFTKFQH